MNSTEILEGNKLIAEFVGEEAPGNPIYKVYKLQQGFISEYDLEYNSSWDWLMPVVEKIEHLYETPTSLPLFNINSHYCKFALTHPHKYKVFIVGSYKTSPEEIKANSKIEAAWMVAVEFIKYYNKQKQQ